MAKGIVSTFNPRILILAIHGPYQPWMSILMDGQLQTWMKHVDDVKIVNIFGRKINSRWLNFDQKIYFLRWSKSRFISYMSLFVEAILKKAFLVNRYKPRTRSYTSDDLGDVWEIQMPDTLMLQGVKNISALCESLKFEYDYLVTTITSSYINTSALSEALQNTPRDNFVGGRIEINGKKKFQQGSFRVYSRDVVEYVKENAKQYKHWQIEDIAMGNLIDRKYKVFSELANVTVQSLNEISSLDEVLLGEICSFRCKSVTKEGIRSDVAIMKEINKLLRGS